MMAGMIKAMLTKARDDARKVFDRAGQMQTRVVCMRYLPPVL